MISGFHAIIYTKDAEADKAFFKDVLKLPNVDVGHGWLIFGLPPAEIAMHPAENETGQEVYLMCDDINLFVKEMENHGVSCTEIHDQGWGRLTQIKLPGGSELGVYEPRHARPPQP